MYWWYWWRTGFFFFGGGGSKKSLINWVSHNFPSQAATALLLFAITNGTQSLSDTPIARFEVLTAMLLKIWDYWGVNVVSWLPEIILLLSVTTQLASLKLALYSRCATCVLPFLHTWVWLKKISPVTQTTIQQDITNVRIHERVVINSKF